MIQALRRTPPQKCLTARGPFWVVVAGMTAAFILFLVLDMAEQTVMGQSSSSWRLLHFLRGFLATSAGMYCVWTYMRGKEQEIHKLRDCLSDQLVQKTRQLTEADKALAEQREDFISALRLNLYTPILAHRQAVNLLLDKEFGDLADAQIDVLNLMQENDERLCLLVDRLVEIYRYQNGIKHLNRRVVEIAVLRERIDNQFPSQITCGSLRVVLGTEESALVNCDIDEVSRLIGILVTNALHYARRQSVLRINIINSELVLEVEDDGGVMRLDDVAKLFTRFSSESACGQRNPIVGTGLCLCAQITQAHGGAIVCEVVNGVSTTFKVKLPLLELLVPQAIPDNPRNEKDH